MNRLLEGGAGRTVPGGGGRGRTVDGGHGALCGGPAATVAGGPGGRHASLGLAVLDEKAFGPSDTHRCVALLASSAPEPSRIQRARRWAWN